MAKQFPELRERLLEAGVAPRHVRRYLTELAEHLADLTREEERAGLGHVEAESAALLRLGGTDDLVRAMTEKPALEAWCVRAPWAAFGLAPVSVLAAAWLVALVLLWSGWKIFLPGSSTPFVRIDGAAVAYFGIGRLLYYGAPIVIGWGIGMTAARQRIRSLWRVAGLIPIAVIDVTARVYAVRPAFPLGAGRVGLDFPAMASATGIFYVLPRALAILALMTLPYLIWRLRGERASA